MNYNIKDLSLVEKQITVMVPDKEVNIALKVIIDQKRSDITKDGFRKGKAPEPDFKRAQRGDPFSYRPTDFCC